MMYVRKTSVCVFLICVVLVSGCVNRIKPVELEASVRRLTPTLQSVLLDEEHESVPTGEQLLEMAFEIRPEIHNQLKTLPVSVWHNNEIVIVLVASPNNECWFEDFSETSFVDRQCYKDDPLKPAEFTLIPLEDDTK